MPPTVQPKGVATERTWLILEQSVTLDMRIKIKHLKRVGGIHTFSKTLYLRSAGKGQGSDYLLLKLLQRSALF